jgi:trigger factor
LKTVIKDISSYKRRLEIEVDDSEVGPYLEKAYHSYQKKINIDGFRKGKAPLSIIKKRFGDAIRAEVTDDMIQKFYKKAVEEEKLSVVSPANILDFSFGEGGPLKFTAEVEVEPEIEITDYKGFKVEKEIMKVTNDDVNTTLEMLQEQKAERHPVKGSAAPGHIIEGNVQALDSSGVPLVGNKWENVVIELGKPPLGELVQDQLLGVAVGDKKQFTIIQPERDVDGKVSQKESRYSIDVKSIQEKTLPELNDEFAKAMGEFQNFEELKEDILQRLKLQKDDEAERLLNTRLVDEIIRRNDIEIPPSMVENVLQSSWAEYEKNPDRDIDENKFREENRASVIWNIKWHLIQKKIIEMEGLEVSDQEVESEIEKMAKASPKNEKRIKAQFKDPSRRRRVKENLLEQKLLRMIKDNIKIKEVVIKRPKQKESRIITA